jgi:hypothetical protein
VEAERNEEALLGEPSRWNDKQDQVDGRNQTIISDVNEIQSI